MAHEENLTICYLSDLIDSVYMLNCILISSIRKTDNSAKCRKMRISEILEFEKDFF